MSRWLLSEWHDFNVAASGWVAGAGEGQKVSWYNEEGYWANVLIQSHP